MDMCKDVLVCSCCVCTVAVHMQMCSCMSMSCVIEGKKHITGG